MMGNVSDKRQFDRSSWDPALRKSMMVLHNGRADMQRRIDTLSTRLWIACGALGFTSAILAGVIVLLFDNR